MNSYQVSICTPGSRETIWTKCLVYKGHTCMYMHLVGFRPMTFWLQVESTTTTPQYSHIHEHVPLQLKLAVQLIMFGIMYSCIHVQCNVHLPDLHWILLEVLICNTQKNKKIHIKFLFIFLFNQIIQGWPVNTGVGNSYQVVNTTLLILMTTGNTRKYLEILVTPLPRRVPEALCFRVVRPSVSPP